jgi:hypothetical protein
LTSSKVASLVKKYIMLAISKAADLNKLCTRRSTVLSFPLQRGSPAQAYVIAVILTKKISLQHRHLVAYDDTVLVRQVLHVGCVGEALDGDQKLAIGHVVNLNLLQFFKYKTGYLQQRDLKWNNFYQFVEGA